MRIFQRRFFFFFDKNIRCDPSLELSRRDGANDGSHNMFLWRNRLIIPLPLLNLDCCKGCWFRNEVGVSIL